MTGAGSRPADRMTSLSELAWLFLRLGATAFGGPAAHIAMMRREVVEKRAWLTDEAFLDLVSATNLIPGPSSTELAIHIGRERRGWAGLLVAGVCFIGPAFLIVLGLAWGYTRYGTLPAVDGVLYGIKPVIIAVIAHALWTLGRTAIKSVWLGIVGAAALAATLAGVHELIVLAAAGGLVVIARGVGPRSAPAAWFPWPLLATGGASAVVATISLASIFGVFLKIGAVLFGSGYVLIAFLRSDLVERLQWLTETQLLDAVAVGQVTPGPVFTTATFIGYLLAGTGGACVATLGIFLPAFVFVAITAPIIPKLRSSPLASALLDGINVASLALMAAVTYQIARASLIDAPTIALAVIGAVLLIRWKISSMWLVLAGGLAGALLALR
ncbi:MAG: chromate efflux transporter [Deltaproteobacteria bacterium]|nr:chromate efflux transporter [Deltaproteobacteria bacterium]